MSPGGGLSLSAVTSSLQLGGHCFVAVCELHGIPNHIGVELQVVVVIREYSRSATVYPSAFEPNGSLKARGRGHSRMSHRTQQSTRFADADDDYFVD